MAAYKMRGKREAVVSREADVVVGGGMEVVARGAGDGWVEWRVLHPPTPTTRCGQVLIGGNWSKGV